MRSPEEYVSILIALYKNMSDRFADNRLKLYIVQSHVDKPLKTEIPESKYSHHIQAGTFFTERRICDLNDMSNCPDNISDRNKRYSEATAMYWIYKNIDSLYVGIEHYRRRLDLDDEQYEKYINDNVDIITSIPIDTGSTIEDQYRLYHYASDWDLFMDILDEYDNKYSEYAKKCFKGRMFHPYNIHVFRSDLYKDFCDLAFPICDAFFRRSYQKTDIFQRRDVGFIMERLSHLYIMYKKSQGYNVIEVPVTKLSTEKWLPEHECDLSNSNEVYNACNRLYCADQITKSNNLLGVAIDSGLRPDERLSAFIRLSEAALDEQSALPRSMYEYLPKEFRENIDILTEIWSKFEMIVGIYFRTRDDRSLDKLTEFIKLTGFSDIALKAAITYCKGDAPNVFS